ncbi:efflux transporter outer membrane subunit [Anaeromyxobacter paludicola]|uniref:Outer membrane efflux protein n=1 Tax=Anaeromyxobacter paludicola TaxID=2918171 RepID=A0ABN6NDF1_9BACT|nr:efflux transporter outer membrane subunit [Anaeromyxobacter paludicola]BDG10018.1 outer membrane efflux protein [Anaeromyxobacter paludicola]
MTSRALLPAALALGLCACAASRAHERPQADVPPTWNRQAEASGAPAADSRWWSRFGDPALDRLVAEALRRNNDLAAAALKVRRARLEAGLAAGAQLPSVAAGPSAAVARSFGPGAGTSATYGLSGTVTWEADLWGRLASQRSAAEWEASATELDRESAALALTGTTATLYWKVAYLKQRLALSAQSVAAAKRALEIARALKDAGGGSGLDVAQAEQTTASQEAAHTQLEQQLVEARNALAILFDRAPGAVADEPETLPAALPDVAAGLPAELLSRRPDVRAAELRVRAAWATADATRASFYPTLTLTGSLGVTSDALSRLVQNPIGTLGAALALPFLQYRDAQRKTGIAEVEAEGTVLTFRQTLYKALADVEDALSARTQYRLQAERLDRSLSAARRAESLSEIRYRAGAVLLKVWLDAQEARRQAEVAALQNRLDQLQAHVTLTEALGGDTLPL